MFVYLTKFLCFCLCFKLLKGKNEDMKFLEKKLKSGDFSGLHAECLTDTWIGKDRFFLSLIHSLLSHSHKDVSTKHFDCFRWAFIDLTAGPFAWGPAVGGEGVRTELTLPNVGKTIGAVAGMYFLFH